MQVNILNEMKMESVIDENDKLTVTTTGARYVFDKLSSAGRILCYQLINEERLAATISFHFPFSSLTLKSVLGKASKTTPFFCRILLS